MIFWTIITCLKRRVSDRHKTMTKAFEIFQKLLPAAVFMATMTSQHGGYFMFKVI